MVDETGLDWTKNLPVETGLWTKSLCSIYGMGVALLKACTLLPYIVYRLAPIYTYVYSSKPEQEVESHRPNSMPIK
jgi:predicted acyltransferase